MSLIERFVVGVDIQTFSSRIVRRQVLLQRELNRILDAAAEEAGISRARWERRAEGDGEVAALPTDVDLLAAVRRFVTELDLRLTDHNEDHSPETRIRLRVAMHIDTVTAGELGYAGQAFVVLQRLLDSAPVRDALTRTQDANLAQIISESLFEKVVVPELGGLRPRQFRKVLVDLPAKNFRQTAYVYIPGARIPHPEPAPAVHGARPLSSPWPDLQLLMGSAPDRPRDPRPAPAPVEPPPVRLPEPPDPVVLDRDVRELLAEISRNLKEDRIQRADTLTTAVLLKAVDRENKGWLRASDGPRLPFELLTEVDRLWAQSSGNAWGFRAQRERLARLGITNSADFLKHSLALGWRRAEDDVLPPYADFIARKVHSVPFFPTLRSPERERFPEWHDEWSATVRAVHARLRSQE